MDYSFSPTHVIGGETIVVNRDYIHLLLNTYIYTFYVLL